MTRLGADGLTLGTRADGCSRLTLLHVVDAALSVAYLIESALARRRTTLLESAKACLCEAQAHGDASGL